MLKNSHNRKLLTIIFILILTLGAFAKYSGVTQSFYLIKYDSLISNELLYLNDIYITNSSFENYSILFKFIKFFKINIFNDFIGFFIYLLFVSISVYSINQIIKKSFININFYQKLVFIIILLNTNFLFLKGIHTSILSGRFDSPTFIANCLVFYLIYKSIDHKWLQSMIVASLIILINTKVAWLPVIVSCIYLIVNNKKNFKNLFYLLIPTIIISFFYYLNFNVFENSYDENILLIKEAMSRDEEESVFHLHNFYRLVLFYISFFLFYFLIRKEKSNFFIFCKTTIILSFIIALFAYLYTYKFYEYFPLVNIVSLNPVRAMSLYSILFCISLIYFIFTLKINEFLKLSLIIAFFLIGFVGLSYKSIALLILIFLFSIFYLIILKTFPLINNKLEYIQKNINIISIIILLSGSCFLYLNIVNYRLNEFDSFLFKNEKKWTTIGNLSLEEENFKMSLYNLRGCEDFILHYVFWDRDLYHFHNFLAQKSRLIADSANFRNNINYLNIHNQRIKIHNEVKNAFEMNRGINPSILESLKDLNIVLLFEIHHIEKINIIANIKMNEYNESDIDPNIKSWHPYYNYLKTNLLSNNEFEIHLLDTFKPPYILLEFKKDNLPSKINNCI